MTSLQPARHPAGILADYKMNKQDQVELDKRAIYKPVGQLRGSGFVEACLKICSSRIEPRILLQAHPKEKYC